jgi:hypothetical protein
VTNIASSNHHSLASSGQHSLASHLVGYLVLVLVVIVVIVAVASIFSPRWRRVAPRATAWLIGGAAATYLVGRAAAEFWTVNYSDPASYQRSWGGPSLAGVFAVHSGPGLVVLIVAGGWLRRRLARPSSPARSSDLASREQPASVRRSYRCDN